MNQLKEDEALTVDDRDLRSYSSPRTPHVPRSYPRVWKRSTMACASERALHACAKSGCTCTHAQKGPQDRRRCDKEYPIVCRSSIAKPFRTLGCEAERLLPVIHSRFSLGCRGRLGVQACALFPPEYEGRGETR